MMICHCYRHLDDEEFRVVVVPYRDNTCVVKKLAVDACLDLYRYYPDRVVVICGQPDED